MIVAIADTHSVIWYLFSNPKLGAAASAFIERTIADGDHIGVSAITIAEMVYLQEKERIPSDSLAQLHRATGDPKAVLRHIPLDETIALKMSEIPRAEVPDLPDRIIAATAIAFAVPLLSRDSKIRASAVETIW